MDDQNSPNPSTARSCMLWLDLQPGQVSLEIALSCLKVLCSVYYRGRNIASFAFLTPDFGYKGHCTQQYYLPVLTAW